MISGSRIDISPLSGSLDNGATILVPNNRLRDAIIDSVARQRSQDVFPTPAVFAIDIWIKRLWGQAAAFGIAPCAQTAILSSIEEQYLWLGLIEASLDSYPLLNPEETAHAVSQAWQTMKLWQLDRPALEAFSSIPDTAAFLAWSEEFVSHCRQSSVISLTVATEILGTTLPKPVQPLLPDEVVLVNFYETPPLYQSLFEGLGLHRRVTTVNPEAAIVARTARMALPDPHSELAACAGWVAEKLAHDRNAHIGVICNARQDRQAAFTRALADTLDPRALFDFCSDGTLCNSAGSDSSLAQAGFVHDALLILGLLHDQQGSDELCRLLKSPYIAGADNEAEPRLAMERLMRRRFTRRCHVQEFSHYLQQENSDSHCPALAAALLGLRTRLRRMPARDSAAAWAACFAELLELFEWPGALLSTYERRLHEQWQGALEQFAAAGVTLGRLDGATALSRLHRLCQQTPQWRESGIGRQVSYYSASEAVGLHFDHLWLLGCDDQGWPPPAAPSPFLPHSLQKEAGIPASHSESQYTVAAREFGLLCRAVAGELMASHYISDGDEEFRPSSFILGFPETDAIAQTPVINRYAHDRRGQHTLTTIADRTTVPLAPSAQSRGGHEVLSDQSACPFRAFAKHRLRAEPLEDFNIGLDQRQRGSAIHMALDCLFSHIPDQSALAALDEEARQARCRQAAELAVDYLLRRQRRIMTPRYRTIELRRLQSLLLAFLGEEDGRADFQVIARERELPWCHRDLRLNLKIDRIDRLGDGRLAIIDYKSGKRTPALHSWLQERPEDMQLPVYSVAAAGLAEGEISTVALAHINAAKTGYSPLAADAHFHPGIKPVAENRFVDMEWDELISLFRDRVTAMADEFIRGRLPVEPVNGHATCRYCHLQPLCRVHEILGGGDEPGEDAL